MNAMIDTTDDPSDGFRIAFHIDSGPLEALVTGWIDTVEAVIAMFMRLAEELRRTSSDRLLVIDHTRGVVPPEDEIHKLMTAIAGRGFEHVRVAYVDARGTAVSRMEVVEILGREQGYVCRVFDNVQRARIWLNYGDDWA
jgi:hypothetical protein